MRLSHNGKIKLSARLRQMRQIWKLSFSFLVWIWSTYLKELLIKCIEKTGFLKRETISAQRLQLMNLNFYWGFFGELFHIWMGVSRLLLGQKMCIVCTVWVPSITPYRPTCNPSFFFSFELWPTRAFDSFLNSLLPINWGYIQAQPFLQVFIWNTNSHFHLNATSSVW